MEERVKKLEINNIVTSATFAKIGKKIILDPDEDEECTMDSRLTVAVDGEYVRAMQKGLSGAFTTDEIKSLVDLSFEKHDLLKKYIKDANKE